MPPCSGCVLPVQASTVPVSAGADPGLGPALLWAVAAQLELSSLSCMVFQECLLLFGLCGSFLPQLARTDSRPQGLGAFLPSSDRSLLGGPLLPCVSTPVSPARVAVLREGGQVLHTLRREQGTPENHPHLLSMT